MIVAAALLLGLASSRVEPVTLVEAVSAGVKVRVITVNLNDPRVRVDAQVSANFPGRAEPFASMVARSKPLAAVNGAYFSKSTLLPIGDIVVEGKVVREGKMGTALAITADNKAVIRRVTWGHREDWSAYRTVLACGPMLVQGGKVDVLPSAEGFGDPHIMATTRRMGVGLKPDGTLLIVTTLRGVDFNQWAAVMRGLGCESAMNLDAGASLAMFTKGKFYDRPGRNLTNILTVRYSNQSGTGR